MYSNMFRFQGYTLVNLGQCVCPHHSIPDACLPIAPETHSHLVLATPHLLYCHHPFQATAMLTLSLQPGFAFWRIPYPHPCCLHVCFSHRTQSFLKRDPVVCHRSSLFRSGSLSDGQSHLFSALPVDSHMSF